MTRLSGCLALLLGALFVSGGFTSARSPRLQDAPDIARPHVPWCPRCR